MIGRDGLYTRAVRVGTGSGRLGTVARALPFVSVESRSRNTDKRFGWMNKLKYDSVDTE